MKNNKIKLSDIARLKKIIVKPKQIKETSYLGLEHIEKQTLSINSIGTSKGLESNKYLFSEGDVLFGKLRPYFRKVFLPKFEGICSTDIWVIESLDKSKTPNNFLFYLLADKSFVGFANLGSTGTRMPRADWKHVSKYQVFDFNYNEKNIISSNLSLFDNKINLNHKINETLQEIINLTFNSWFINFDIIQNKKNKKLRFFSKEIIDLFPDTFEKSDLGMIPKGWEVKPFGKIIEKYIDNRGKTPPTVDEINIPLVEIKDLNNSSLFPSLNTDKHVSLETYNHWFRDHIQKYDIIISTVGTVGLTSFVYDTNFAIAQNLLGLRFASKFLSLYMFFYIKSEYFKNQINSRLVETVQKSIKRKDLDKIPVLIPNQKILEKFFDEINNLIDKQFINISENKILIEIRDSLIPKLFTRKINISNMENFSTVLKNQ